MPDILIVEDDWLIAQDFAAALRIAGHGVVGPCPSVEAALSAIAAHPVDLALLDIELGRERSIGLTPVLEAKGIPFLFVSGHDRRELPQALQAHVTLSKPVLRPVLLAAIATLLERAAAGREPG